MNIEYLPCSVLLDIMTVGDQRERLDTCVRQMRLQQRVDFARRRLPIAFDIDRADRHAQLLELFGFVVAQLYVFKLGGVGDQR
jgi:hypothetical protein